MSGPARPSEERLFELLAARAMDDLSPAEERELNELRAAFPHMQDDELDQVASSVVMAHTPLHLPPLPAALRERIVSQAEAHLPGRSTIPMPPAAVTGSTATATRRELLAWIVAAAAIFCALSIWRWNRVGQTQIASPEERRRLLLAAGGDVMRIPWQPGKHPFANPVSGDVAYSVGKQEGYMHFHGLPANDPRKEQYQLWIIDPTRDDEPIDGGVFDASGAADIVVPITAKLAVNAPQAFAITVEKPGGVVVSKQDRLPLLAAVK